MITRALDFLNRRSKGWACRLVQLTGKHQHRIHPKHLIPQDRGWFLDHLKPTDRLLDLGCGTGAHGLAASWVIRWIGGTVFCDRHQPGHPSLQWRFVQADLEDPLPFKDQAFDAVLMLDVLEHLNDRTQALDEVNRMLKPGGRLFLSVPNRMTTWRRRLRAAGLFPFSDPDHKTEYSVLEIAVELRDAAFHVDSIAPVPALDTPWAGLIDLVGGLHLPTYRRLVAWKRRAALANPAESTGFLIVARKT